MFDAFKRDEQRVYPSWQDNPHLVRERALTRLKWLGGDVATAGMPEGITVIRTGNARFEIFEHGRRVLVTSKSAQHGRYEDAIQQVLDWIDERYPEEIMTDNLKLSEKAIGFLHQLDAAGGSANPKTLKGDQGVFSLVAALRKKGLVRELGDGSISLTKDGMDALDNADTPPVNEAPRRMTGVRFEHTPKGTPTPTPKEPTPSTALAAPTAPADPSTIAQAPAAADLPACGEADCAHKRVLDYLMQESPAIRQAVERIFALDGAMKKLRDVEV